MPTVAAASDGAAGELDVLHTFKQIVVPGSALQEPRKVQVHLWYPADEDGLRDRAKAMYRSRLWGDSPLPAGWLPLSWQVEAEIARKDDADGPHIDPYGAAFPVIVFSHGNVNDPIDYAHTLELIASAGFVVAAPAHVNNTQDDLRIDYVNTQAGQELIPCNDGRSWSATSRCSRTNVPFSMADRVRDISYVLDWLPSWFGDRVDMDAVGVMGHSRGTVTALAAAGGSAAWSQSPNCQPDALLCWPLQAEPRVKAVMGLAIGALGITDKVDLDEITVPTLLVGGLLDETSAPSVSQFAFSSIPADTDKTLVFLENARHRSFDSTYCDQTQAAGSIADAEPNAKLDLHTVRGIVAPGTTGQGTSGKATEFCHRATFYPTPQFPESVDIRGLVEALLGDPSFFETQKVPTTGLETDEVKEQVKQLAVTFFRRVLQ